MRAVHELTRLDPEAKRDLLASHARTYDLFIETGTYLGMTSARLAGSYKTVHTIECDCALFENARRRLRPHRNVNCYHGDSAVILRDILPDIDRPAVFWLDAHYTGGITSRVRVNTPIMAELQALFTHRIDTHLILIDDARWFVGRNGYPSVRALQAFARNNSPYDMCIHDDIIRIFRDDEWTNPQSLFIGESVQEEPAAASAA